MRENLQDETMDNQHTLDVDLSWLAAAIEGEGCITIERNGVLQKDGERNLVPTVLVTNTNPEFIAAAVKIIERIGVKYYLKTQNQKRGWKLTLKVKISNHAHVHNLLTAVRPFLHTKIGQCDLVLRFIAERRSYKTPKRARITDEQRNIVVEIRKLNQRGDRDCTPHTEKSA